MTADDSAVKKVSQGLRQTRSLKSRAAAVKKDRKSAFSFYSKPREVQSEKAMEVHAVLAAEPFLILYCGSSLKI